MSEKDNTAIATIDRSWTWSERIFGILPQTISATIFAGPATVMVWLATTPLYFKMLASLWIVLTVVTFIDIWLARPWPHFKKWFNSNFRRGELAKIRLASLQVQREQWQSKIKNVTDTLKARQAEYDAAMEKARAGDLSDFLHNNFPKGVYVNIEWPDLYSEYGNLTVRAPWRIISFGIAGSAKLQEVGVLAGWQILVQLNAILDQFDAVGLLINNMSAKAQEIDYEINSIGNGTWRP
jgi:hypothetical protein